MTGGFSALFSSKSICRFCHIQYEDLDTCIHDLASDKSYDRWTEAEYDSFTSTLPTITENIDINLHVDDSDESTDCEDILVEDEVIFDHLSMEQDSDAETEINKWGLKMRCPLNLLDSFHCVMGFPCDLMHDLLGNLTWQIANTPPLRSREVC